MEDGERLSLEQMRAFLEAGEEVAFRPTTGGTADRYTFRAVAEK